jgi:hypothetical protein
MGPVAESAILAMRYSLRTLLILLALGPMMIWGSNWALQPKLTNNRPMDAARATQEGLCLAVWHYEHQEGRLPSALAALQAAAMYKGTMTDHWGNEFRLTVIDASSGDFSFWSCGRDGIGSTPDDITGPR